jgi:hypothetical protein
MALVGLLAFGLIAQGSSGQEDGVYAAANQSPIVATLFQRQP